jgi:hypothetical protein
MSCNNQIKKSIEEWLLSQGYPLEMRVANEWRNSGFHVVQSSYYFDPENTSLREIYIIASYEDWTGCINIEFVTECKISKKKPWLLFSSHHTLEGFNQLFGFCINSNSARKKLIEKGIDTVMRLPWMKKIGRTAYGMTQAFSTGEDITFKAATSVLKAAIARKNMFCSQKWEPFIFVFPVIVIDGLIFDCFLSDAGRLCIEQVEDSFFFFPWNISGEVGTCIRVFSLESLPQYIAESKSVAEQITGLLKKDIDEKLRSTR